MAIRLFQINEFVQQTGVVQGATFEVSGIDKIRFVVENAGLTNAFEVKVKIKGQSSFTTLTTLLGNSDKLLDIRTYDLMQINCTVLDGTIIKLLGTGFQTGGVVITEYSNFSEFPPATGSGDLGWDKSANTMFYDEPSSQSWVTSSASSVPLTSTQIAYGSAGNTVTSDATFTFNETTKTVDVQNLNVNSVSVGDNLYKPESVITLSGTDITNKQVNLTQIPINANKTRVSVGGGVEQVYGDDFTVSGSTLSWNGLGLESILEIGDKLIININ